MLEIISVFISSIILITTLYTFGVLTTDNKNYTKIKEIKTIIYIIFCSLINTCIFLLLNGMMKTLLMCLMYAIFLYLLIYKEFNKSIFAAIIYTILGIIPDLITIGIATQLLCVDKEHYYRNIAGSVLGNTIISIETIVIVFLLKNILKKIINYNFSTSKKIIFTSILTIVFIAFFFYKFAIGYRMNDDILVYLISILGFMIILITLFKQKIENEAISKKYDDLLNIMKNYESDIEEQRTMIHETRNELMTIKSKINDKEKEAEIIKYIDSIMGDKVSSKMSKYSKFKYLPSNGIKGFFYYKFIEAEKRDVKVSVNISKKIENSFLGKIDTSNFKDLVRIIGVYLDNAIDASSESKEKKLGIEIYLIKKDIEIIISNTFENEINTEKLGKEKFTTKGKNRGHGLLLVRHILNNNSNIEVSNEIINNLYIQKIKIKKSVI